MTVKRQQQQGTDVILSYVMTTDSILDHAWTFTTFTFI